MLNHTGTQIIKTKRLLLREIRESDYKDIYAYAQKAEVARYVSWNAHKSLNDSKEVCKMWVKQYETGDKYHWAIIFGGKMQHRGGKTHWRDCLSRLDFGQRLLESRYNDGSRHCGS